MRRLTRVGVALALTGCPGPTPPSVVPTPAEPTQAERAQVSRQDALVAFARAYAAVRYFHPSDAAQAAEWDQVAADGVARVGTATTYAELTAALRTALRPYANGMQLWVEPDPAPPVPKPPHRRAGLVYWQHQGYEGTPISLFRPPYSSVRVTPSTRYERRFAEAPDPSRPYETALVGPLRMRLPLVLEPEEAADTPPPPPAAVDPMDLARPDVREALVIDMWAVLRHFYPYQDEVQVAWEAVLREALVNTQDDATVEDVLDSIRTLTRALVDGHARVERDGMRGLGYLPLRTECIGSEVVVTASEDPALRPGDVVVRHDGAPAFERAQQIATRLSGTSQWTRFRACTWDGARGPGGGPVTLDVERDGAEQAVQTTYARRSVMPPTRPEPFTTLTPGVLYVDLTRLSWTDLKPRLDEMAAAEGIVFDLRGYPIHNDDLLDHLMTVSEDATWMHVPRFIEPGGVPVGYADIGWNRTPSQPHIGAATAFLISPAAISYAESILSYVHTHQLGTLIGTPTAGANGDIVRHDGLAGFYIVFSGMRVTRHDGSPFHNEGVQPDIVASPTRAGVREGRDEVLELGLQTVQNARKARAAEAARASESDAR
ncbi:MAG: S41 family peptidase [Myxococcota bacterium]